MSGRTASERTVRREVFQRFYVIIETVNVPV